MEIRIKWLLGSGSTIGKERRKKCLEKKCKGWINKKENRH